MNSGDIQRGTHIKISDDISITHRRYNSCQSMLDMRGKVYRIDYEPGPGQDYLDFKGYTWAMEDIFLADEDIEIPEQHFHFDIKEMAT